MTAVRKELSRRRKPLWFATAFVALAAVLVFAFAASANLPGSTFEGNDGNFVVNTTGNTDWVNAPGGVTTGVDLATGQTDNSFGNGTKESDINVTVGTGSIPNSKADLGNFYVASETLASNNHVLLYLGWTRVNTSGTTNFDFEINKEAQPDLTTPGPKTLVRTPGDIIINYDFQGGAQKPTLAFRTWLANGTWSDATPLTGTTGEAEVNRVSLTNPLAVSPSPSTAPAFTFGEAAIDLTAAGIVAEGDCAPFSSAYVKSRASDAFTSAVKDFIAPVSISLSNCGSITVIKHTNPRGLDQAFGYTTTGGLDPATFSLNDAGNSGGGDSAGNTKVYTDVQPGTYTVTEDADPLGFAFADLDCTGGGANTTTSDRTATIGLEGGEDVVCTYVNDQQLGAIRVVKSRKHAADGTGSHPHAGVSFTIAGESVVTDANGVACVDGLPFGTYDATETLPDGYHADQDLTQSATVDNNTSCDSDPYGGETLNFGNTPLTDVTISIDSQVDGGTASSVDCDNDDLDLTTDAVGDGSATASDQEPQIIHCTITVDP